MEKQNTEISDEKDWLLQLLVNFANTSIQGMKNKKTGENSGLSGIAPPPRLERGTP